MPFAAQLYPALIQIAIIVRALANGSIKFATTASDDAINRLLPLLLTYHNCPSAAV